MYSTPQTSTRGNHHLLPYQLRSVWLCFYTMCGSDFCQVLVTDLLLGPQILLDPDLDICFFLFCVAFILYLGGDLAVI